ncbi:MAG: hypothetical protein ACLQVX_21405, partial [Limisphaerales bacterium]
PKKDDAPEILRKMHVRFTGLQELYAQLIATSPEMDDYFYDTCEADNIPLPIALRLLKRSMNDALFVDTQLGIDDDDIKASDLLGVINQIDFDKPDIRPPSKLDIVIRPDMDLAEIRSYGFPFQDYTDRELLALFYQLCRLPTARLLTGTTIQPHKRFASLATQFFPNFYKTKCAAGGMTAYDAFFSDKYLARALELERKYDASEQFTMNSLRNYLRFAYDTRAVSNFNPEVAKLIYDSYGGDGKIYDYAAGWGGRLVGFLASNLGREYVGIDVNSDNFGPYRQISQLYTLSDHDWFSSNGPVKQTHLIKCPSEQFCPKEYEHYFDLAFSSPAYFNTEQYSADPEQSYLRYPTYEEWKNGFLRKTIQNCVAMLKPGGHFVCNIQDVRHNGHDLPLVEDTKTIAKSLGLRLVIIYKMLIATGLGLKEKEEERSEPILVFAVD